MGPMYPGTLGNLCDRVVVTISVLIFTLFNTDKGLPASKISSPVVGSRGVRLRRATFGLALRLSGFSEDISVRD